ncbi:ATP-dependent Clp protease adaptor ClpS [Prevotella sp. P2-180]|uniref:ATP-dependent Clp protease adaptor ClpS n=1 Tax=Prevotella sp. P2-180 TaxID=2024224 RepID=UPI000B96B25C|nr:ATP-dependent Clp protease adaptor ClpS [Prevotella sp. P2-180]MCI6338065.1 ATP-dependent Clp protease adaptor ClpS [Prevotella sp.]MCI7088714.1 ATP-dependent Clp protease adaptor ClpS [Prevotella sp.]MCI7257273.1 ATP-dependent Clp protease adaptor ClpS [Prevotella sp.]MDD5785134.1 ATP-dependent Clp protease adaptor ClpS [Prevotella sp.]MDD6862264.1 ATP-dependent Clp protease adaptor ClpS [Prevotella sp.]
MKQELLANNEQTQYILKKPSLFNVIMHNDNETTMDFVVTVLMNIYCMTRRDAETTMMKIHNEGSAIVGQYYRDIAETKILLTVNLAKKHNFPLQLTIKEA